MEVGFQNARIIVFLPVEQRRGWGHIPSIDLESRELCWLENEKQVKCLIDSPKNG
jgi:hypothetical protein